MYKNGSGARWDITRCITSNDPMLLQQQKHFTLIVVRVGVHLETLALEVGA